MSVAAIIGYHPGTAAGPDYLPIATEASFAAEWLPAAAQLNCVWLPSFQAGTQVPLDALPAVCEEFLRLRDHFAGAGNASAQLRERSQWLVAQLSSLDLAAVREVFIG